MGGGPDFIADWWGAAPDELGLESSRGLRALGRAAVPAVLRISDDSRLTRGVIADQWGRIEGIARYGNVALQILSRIAGRTFAAREQAERWWEAARREGEFESLVASLGEETYRSQETARRLLQLDRARALPVLVAAARAAHGHTRRFLVEALATDSGREQDAFLLEEVDTGPSLGARIQAARGLARRSSDAWIVPLTEAISERAARAQEPDVRRNAPPWLTEGEDDDRPFGTWDAVRLLVDEGGAAGIAAVRGLYARLSPTDRCTALLATMDTPADGSPAAREADALLAAALGDDEIASGRGGSIDGQSYDSPRLGDLAAFVLGRRWGDPNPFRFDAPPEERAQAADALRQRWRAMQRDR